MSILTRIARGIWLEKDVKGNTEHHTEVTRIPGKLKQRKYN